MDELFIGVVAPVGVDYAVGLDLLEADLRVLGIDAVRVKLSTLIGQVPGVPVKPSDAEDDRIWKLMRAGNEARVRLSDGAALAKLAILSVQKNREERSGEATKPAKKVAYLFLTLKNPDEISFLRRTYGDAFILISFYEPREERVTSLAHKIASSKQSSDMDSERSAAEAIVKADEKDGEKQGQRTGDSFSEADFFVSTSNREDAAKAIKRFVDILFGHPFHTPTVDEYGMFLAWGVSLRSADLSRQVGAAFCDKNGNLIAVGCNDVPRAGGGQYWPGQGDARDFQRGYDSSVREKKRMVGEIVERLKASGWLTDAIGSLSVERRLTELLGPGGDPILSGAGINNILEHGRIVHAEMAAIADAAKRGLSLQDSTLYTTTFPCHVCARHVVAAGAKRVVYVEPYPKSRAKDLHDDSIVVDSHELVEGKVTFQSFNGIAPRKYGAMFSMVDRKLKSGEAVAAAPESSKIKVRALPAHYVVEETLAAKGLSVALANLKESSED
jgi:deoxycytidylate deaminase